MVALMAALDDGSIVADTVMVGMWFSFDSNRCTVLLCTGFVKAWQPLLLSLHFFFFVVVLLVQLPLLLLFCRVWWWRCHCCTGDLWLAHDRSKRKVWHAWEDQNKNTARHFSVRVSASVHSSMFLCTGRE